MSACGIQEWPTMTYTSCKYIQQQTPILFYPKKKKSLYKRYQDHRKAGKSSVPPFHSYLDAISHYSHSLTRDKALGWLTGGYQHLFREALWDRKTGSLFRAMSMRSATAMAVTWYTHCPLQFLPSALSLWALSGDACTGLPSNTGIQLAGIWVPSKS